MKEQKYVGKPIAYLDQNILDGFLKMKVENKNFIDEFKSKVQVVYSDITLHEIHLAGLIDTSYSHSFLQLLQNIDAHHISIKVDKNWKPTNILIGSLSSPFYHYQNFIDNRQYDDISAQVKMNLFAMYGGIKDFNQLAEQQIINQHKLLLDLENQLYTLDHIQFDDPLILQLIKDKEIELADIKQKMPSFEKNVIFSSAKLKEANSEIDAHLAFRKELGINIDKIKKIDFPNVIEKIWRSIQFNNDNLKKLEFNDFFQINLDPTDLKRSLTNFEKIHAIYFILNVIGYMPEKKVKNKAKFIASDRDISHVAYASFCNYFITNDERLLNKSRAIYEYLDIDIDVIDMPLLKKPL